MQRTFDGVAFDVALRQGELGVGAGIVDRQEFIADTKYRDGVVTFEFFRRTIGEFLGAAYLSERHLGSFRRLDYLRTTLHRYQNLRRREHSEFAEIYLQTTSCDERRECRRGSRR